MVVKKAADERRLEESETAEAVMIEVAIVLSFILILLLIACLFSYHQRTFLKKWQPIAEDKLIKGMKIISKQYESKNKKALKNN
tara:strand:+ start:104 stop:355 length:252 start_codon:yes stop_codon:yes gene_type:complete